MKRLIIRLSNIWSDSSSTWLVVVMSPYVFINRKPSTFFKFGSVIEDLLLRLQKSDLYPVSADEPSNGFLIASGGLLSQCYGLFSITRWTQNRFCL